MAEEELEALMLFFFQCFFKGQNPFPSLFARVQPIPVALIDEDVKLRGTVEQRDCIFLPFNSLVGGP